mgnify:CR=1 FL=1
MNNIPINIKSLHINANKALKEKNYAQGKILLQKILLINPNIFEVNFNLAMLNLQLNDVDSSIKYFERAKKINPDASRVYFNLGLAYEKKKEINLAITNYEKVIELDPNNSSAFYNLGSLYKDIYEMKKAEYNLKKSLDLKPDFTYAFINLFDLYDRSNNLEKYNELLEKAKKLLNEKELIIFYSGVHEYKKKNYKSAIEILENLNLNEKYLIQNIAKYGILAKSYDHIKNFDKAFNFFKTNNDLVKDHNGKNINENHFISYVNQRIEFFKNFKISNWKNYSKNEFRDPIFLIGFPRSGTTLLDTVLRTNIFVDVIEEKPILKNFLIKLEKKTKNDFNNLNTLNEEFIDQMQNFYFQEQKKYQKNKSSKIVIDKLPLNIIHIGEILRFFPNAKFVFALRHPYDSVLSCFMQQFILNPAMKNFLSIESSAFLYNLVMKLWTIYKEKFSINFNIIKYEDVVTNFEKTTKEVFEYLGLEWTDQTKDFYLTAKNRIDISTPSYNQVTSPIYLKSMSRWKNYESHFKNSKEYLDKWVYQFNYKL